jgi:hypothetical protein
MKKLFLLLILLLSFQFVSYSQSYLNWEEEDVEEFYEKVSVKQGTLNEQGAEIYFVFFSHPQKDKGTLSALHILPKPRKPTPQSKLCQRVQSCRRTTE